MFSKINHFRGKIELILGEKSSAVYIKRNHLFFRLKLKYNIFCMKWQGFEKRNFNALNLPFVSVIIAGRLECSGMEDRTVVATGRQKSSFVAWNGKMLLLMAASLPPLTVNTVHPLLNFCGSCSLDYILNHGLILTVVFLFNSLINRQ